MYRMRNFYCCIWFSIGLMATSVLGLAKDSQTPATDSATDAGLYLKVQIDQSLKTSALKPGDVVKGTLSQPVYSADREVFPSGSQVQMTVDKLERRRKEPNDHWPWAIKVFLPRHENFPTFRFGNILGSNGAQTPLEVSLVAINQERKVQAQAKSGTKPATTNTVATATSPPASSKKTSTDRIATLLAAPPENEVPAAPLALSGPATLDSGSHAKIILLGNVSAGKSRPGDTFQARIVEPVRSGSTVVLPEGTLLEGEVVKSTPPRMLSRGGSLYLKFNKLTVPGGTTTPVMASLTGIEINERSHTKIDPEGGLRADRPGKAWLLANIGVTAGLAKVSDDTTQLIIEAIVSTATDASTAGSAKIAAACVSGIFILTRHGRDVVIPKFTEMDIMFDRPVTLPGPEKTQQSSAALVEDSNDTRTYDAGFLNTR